MIDNLWGGWDEIARVLVVGVVAYGSLLLLLRGFGKRALAKMNAYDFITTVALGSALASAVLSKDVTSSEAFTAFFLLLALQRLVALLSVHSDRLRKALNNEPALLVRDGELLRNAMRRENLMEADVRSAVRSKGLEEIAEASAVILETDGSMSVIAAAGHPDASGRLRIS